MNSLNRLLFFSLGSIFLLLVPLFWLALTFDYIALENFVLRLSKSKFVGYPIPELLGSPPEENVPDQIHRINLSISVFILSYAVFLIVISYLRGAVLQFKALGCAILIPLFAGVVLFWLRFNAGDHIVSKSEKAELFEFSFYSIATCLVLFFFVFRKSKKAVRTNENLAEKTTSRVPENIQVVAPGKAELPAEGEQVSADIESSQTIDGSNDENVNVEKGEGVGDLVAVEEEPSIALEGNNQEITNENEGNTKEGSAVSEKEDNSADIDLAKLEDVDSSGKEVVETESVEVASFNEDGSSEKQTVSTE
ncbi:MAG: hypothetical protein VX130_08165 [Verrucomicrobiota bacterium]|nr:hypothetical protein [Verrucomicrobiota bacterium]